MASQVPILKLENVNKTLSDSFALTDINLDLEEGEVHAIIGENGSGKSSLLNVISGILPKDSGNIFISGEPVNINSTNDAKKYGITMTHQDPSLFHHFSVAENIFFGSEHSSSSASKTINWPKLHYDCKRLFDNLNIQLDSKKLVRNIGNAQKQLVAIAKAYVSNARIILMDEPSSSFTESEFSILLNIIKELKKTGISILYVSHRIEEISQICDRVTVMRSGKIVGTEKTASMETSKLINMMAGFDIKERYPKLNIKTGSEVLKVSSLSAGNTLRNISFSLRRREILGITGLAGSGRSKIARSIFGVDKIESGEITINGKNVNIKSPLDAIQEGIGYVPEERQIDGLFMYLKIFENMSTPSLHQLSSKYVIDSTLEKDIVNSFVNKLGIKTHTIYNRAESLSGGNQQKVILAKWMMSKSKIFILDEPTRGIDIASKVDVYNLMNDLTTKGASIILISSDVDEITGMCDRVLILYEGKISACIPRSEATRERILYYATGGKANNP